MIDPEEQPDEGSDDYLDAVADALGQIHDNDSLLHSSGEAEEGD